MSLNQPSTKLGELFLTHSNQLKRAALKILGNQERAEDIVQDAYLKAIEAEKTFDVKEPLAYLFQIVRNLSIDRYRRIALENNIFSDEEEGLNIPSSHGIPENIAINRQHLHIISNALNTLPDRTRRAFELYRLGGYTQREIAEKLDISTTLVNFMIHDALICCRQATMTS